MNYSSKNKKEWLQWISQNRAERFLESFLRNVEGAKSRCQYCGNEIFVDIMIGGGVADWSTENGDYGCMNSPDTDDSGCGSHMPEKRESP